MNSRLASRRLSSEKSSVLTKEALQDLNLHDFDVMDGWEPSSGKIYTKVRAISARINQNYDAWPSDELKKSYRTFLGKPVFVNHVNDDPRKARGVVVAARFVENGDDKYVEVIQEVDADRFPMLAHELVTGGLDSVSMGAEARICKCSYCGNEANDMLSMCSHVLGQKGQILGKVNNDGTREDILVYEECRDISFFELSYVFDPADETAVVSNVLTANKKRGYGETALPPQVDTLRDEEEDLGSYFIEPPEEFQEPDLDKDYPDVDRGGPSGDRRVEEQREDYDMARVSRNSRRRNSRRRSDLRRMAKDPYAGWTGGDNYDYKASDDGVYRFVTPKDDGSFSWGVGFNHEDPNSSLGGPDWAVMKDEGDAVSWEEAVDIADSRGADLSMDFRNRRSNRRRRYAEEYGRNDQGEQEEVYISQTPPAEPLETGAGAIDAPNNSQGDRVKTDRNRSTHTNLEARRRRARRKKSYTPGEEVFFYNDNDGIDPAVVGIVDRYPAVDPDGRAFHDSVELRWLEDDGEMQDIVETKNLVPAAPFRNSRRARRKRAETLLPGEKVEWIDSMGNVEPEEAEVLGIVGEEGGEAIYEIRWDDGATETAPEGVLRRASRLRRARRKRASYFEDGDQVRVDGGSAVAEVVGIAEEGDDYVIYEIDWGEGQVDFAPDDALQIVGRKRRSNRRRSRRRMADQSDDFNLNSRADIARNVEDEDLFEAPAETQPKDASRRRARRRTAKMGLGQALGAFEDFLDSKNLDANSLHIMDDITDALREFAGQHEGELDRSTIEALRDTYIFKGASRRRRSNRKKAYFQEGEWVTVDGQGTATVLELVEDGGDYQIYGIEWDTGVYDEAPGEALKLIEGRKRRSNRRRLANPKHRLREDAYGEQVENVYDQFVTHLHNDLGGPDGMEMRDVDDRFDDFVNTYHPNISQDVFDTAGDYVSEQFMADRFAKASRRRRMADTNLDLAAPDGRVNVEAPVSGVTDADAQASQFDKRDYGHNAGDGLADPDLSTDQNWAPGEGKTSKRKASQIEGMRLAEAMVEAGLEKHDDRWKLAESYTKLPASIVRDRISLLSRTASVKSPANHNKGQRPMKSARKSPGLGQGPSLRKVADNKTDDYSLYF